MAVKDEMLAALVEERDTAFMRLHWYLTSLQAAARTKYLTPGFLDEFDRMEAARKRALAAQIALAEYVPGGG